MRLNMRFPAERQARFRSSCGGSRAGAVHLLIADNGIGLPRGCDWKTSPTLGLRLVRTLARQIEADMQVTGAQWNRFFNYIPRRIAHGASNDCEECLADRILIVEDERITAEDLAEVLKDLGYQVSAVVSSGDEAIREAEKNPPDLVLMDIRIKGEMDGAEAARHSAGTL